MTLTDIWTYLNVEAPTITRTVHRLAALGWVDITFGEDRRERVVSLTKRTIEDFPKIKGTIISYETKFLSNLSIAEQDQLMTLLRKLKNSEVTDQ